MRIYFVLIFLFAATVRADLNTLESLTGDWIALRAERALEAESWKQEESRLRMELRLLEDAEDHLQEELDSLRLEAGESETRQADLIEELEARQSRREALAPRVQRGLTAALDRTESLPPPLLHRLEDERAAADAAGRDLSAQLRALLGLHNQWLLLQTSLHDGSLILEIGGGRREMDVLWIGTATAYAVNADATLAATGTPGPDGWVWTENSVIAPRVRQALRIHRQEVPPALIRLPVEGLQ